MVKRSRLNGAFSGCGSPVAMVCARTQPTAGVAYPEDPAALSDAQWARYLFVRENPKGAFAERWSHSGGCRRWFNVIRDTATHKVISSYEAGEPHP